MLKQTNLNGYINDIMKPFHNHEYSEYDIISHIGKSDSPAVSAVRRLRNDCNYHQNGLPSTKDTAAFASIAMTRNSDIVHDVHSRKKLKAIVNKPSEYIDGFHISEIREQERMFQELKKKPFEKHSMVTPSPKITHAKAIARSYRNDLDSEYTKKLLANGPTSPNVEETDSKPAHDWIKCVRKECLHKMKSVSASEKGSLVKLARIITRHDPVEQFHEIQKVYEDANEMKMEVGEIIDTLLCFV